MICFEKMYTIVHKTQFSRSGISHFHDYGCVNVGIFENVSILKADNC